LNTEGIPLQKTRKRKGTPFRSHSSC